MIVSDLQSRLTVHEMFDGQGASDLRDQSPKQHKQIVRRIADDLEMIAGRRAVAKLEGVESDPRAEQVGAKMKFVNLPGAVGETHRLELGMFECLHWDEFGRMLMSFEGWQFKLNLADKSEEI